MDDAQQVPDEDAKYQVMGMPLRHEDTAYDIKQPLEALVIVKGLDEDGDLGYWVAKTYGLSNVEAVGMAHFAAKVALGSTGSS